MVEQIERLAFQHGWEIHLYCQKVEGVRGVSLAPGKNGDSIIWHKVPHIPGPHIVRYLWWLLANCLLRWLDRCFSSTVSDIIYSPGINCFHADVIVVHIVFREFVMRVSGEMQLRHVPVKRWPLIVHRKLYYRLATLFETIVYRDPRVRLIAVSKLVAEQLRAHFNRVDALVIPNAVDTVRFSPRERLSRRDRSRLSFGYDDKDFVLLLIGNDWKKKGLDAVLRALPLLSDIPARLLVVGSDDSRLYELMLGNTLSSDRVRFEQPRSDVLSFYAVADLYVGPSLEDAFCLPILEAMACGLPVIASAQAGASEFIRDGETGLILPDPSDFRQIASLVRKLYADQVLREKMTVDAARYVQTHCDWDQNALETKLVLEAIRDRKHPNS